MLAMPEGSAAPGDRVIPAVRVFVKVQRGGGRMTVCKRAPIALAAVNHVATPTSRRRASILLLPFLGFY